MARAYSQDLRVRVVEAIEEGASQQEAAERYGVGKATAGTWSRRKRATGGVAPGKQGRPEGSKLDAHEDFILALVEANRDITLSEIAEKLDAERGVRAVVSQIWYFFDRRGITFKKRPHTPPNRRARTSPPRARLGGKSK